MMWAVSVHDTVLRKSIGMPTAAACEAESSNEPKTMIASYLRLELMNTEPSQ